MDTLEDEESELDHGHEIFSLSEDEWIIYSIKCAATPCSFMWDTFKVKEIKEIIFEIKIIIKEL